MFEDTFFDALVADDLNNIVLLAAQICEMPVSAIAISNGNKAMLMASPGFPKTDIAELAPFIGGDQLIVQDVSADGRFTGSALLKTGLPIRFFAAIPFETPKDFPNACLCIMDYQPGNITPQQSSALLLLANQASAIIKLKAENLSISRRNEDFQSSGTGINTISDGRLDAVAELDRQRDFYENILNKLPTDIAVFDADHKYLFVNPGAIGVEEYRKYIIGKDDYEYVAFRKRDVSIADSRREKFLQVKNTGKEIRWEESMKGPKGNTLTHLRRMFPVFDDNGELSIVIGFGIDITDRKLMEEKQAVLVNQLSAQNIQLTDFCNIVSHNLRAPLVNMSMLVELIEETVDAEEQKLLISKLNPVIDNLHTTFNELVESIQIKQDIDIPSENIHLQDCLQRTLESMDAEIKKSGAVITSNFGEAPTVYFPPKYLHSIFHNLVSNSLKYHSPKRNPIIRLESKKRNGGVLFSVNDNGLGIDLVKQKDNIFKIGKVFHRHHDAKGFGLYMTKTQVEAMNSKIWAESTPGVGSTFFIEFTNQQA